MARIEKLADSREADDIAKELPLAMQRFEILHMQVSAIRDNTEIDEIEEWKMSYKNIMKQCNAYKDGPKN